MTYYFFYFVPLTFHHLNYLPLGNQDEIYYFDLSLLTYSGAVLLLFEKEVVGGEGNTKKTRGTGHLHHKVNWKQSFSSSMSTFLPLSLYQIPRKKKFFWGVLGVKTLSRGAPEKNFADRTLGQQYLNTHFTKIIPIDAY